MLRAFILLGLTMADASFVRKPEEVRVALAAAAQAGEVRQLADGWAAYLGGFSSGAIGDTKTFNSANQVAVPKTVGVVIIDGAPLWWDHSVNSATPVPPIGAAAGDRDFFLGAAVGNAASADTTCTVNLNREPKYIIDFHRDGGATEIVKTAGAPYLYNRGGSMEAGFSATAEAQKLDWLSRRSFPKGANWVLEAVVTVVETCDADVGDLTIGVSNGTHASDFQTVAEFVAFHFDLGADLDLDAESDDGTTDVNPTDTTLNWAVGTPIHLVIDGRDENDCQLYVNGVNVLPATVFTQAAAAGPLKAIFHLEKSADDSPGRVQLDMLRVRIAEQ